MTDRTGHMGNTFPLSGGGVAAVEGVFGRLAGVVLKRRFRIRPQRLRLSPWQAPQNVTRIMLGTTLAPPAREGRHNAWPMDGGKDHVDRHLLKRPRSRRRGPNDAVYAVGRVQLVHRRGASDPHSCGGRQGRSIGRGDAMSGLRAAEAGVQLPLPCAFARRRLEVLSSSYRGPGP